MSLGALEVHACPLGAIFFDELCLLISLYLVPQARVLMSPQGAYLFPFIESAKSDRKISKKAKKGRIHEADDRRQK